jgi:hypothetical protein
MDLTHLYSDVDDFVKENSSFNAKLLAAEPKRAYSPRP